jgi:hypothetical protein
VLLHTAGEPVTGDEVVGQLVTRYPERAGQDYTALKATVSKILGHIEGQGGVERGRFRPEVQSEITMTARQKATVRQLLELFENFSSKDRAFLAEGRARATEIINDPSRFRALLTKARAASTNANRHSTEEVAGAVLAILHQAPNRPLGQICDAITEQYEITLTLERIKQVVALLRRQGAVVISSPGRPIRYSSAVTSAPE